MANPKLAYKIVGRGCSHTFACTLFVSQADNFKVNTKRSASVVLPGDGMVSETWSLLIGLLPHQHQSRTF